MSSPDEAPPKSKVTTTTGHAARGSDTIDIFLLTSGLLLILSAAFYGRLTEIDLPGGAALKFAAATAAKARAKAKQTLRERNHDATPELVERAYVLTLDALSRKYWGAPAEPPDDALDEAAKEAVDEIEEEAQETKPAN